MAKRDANESGSSCEEKNAKRRRTVVSNRELKPRNLPSYFARKYEMEVVNALEVIETDVKLGKRIRWSILLPVLRAVRVNDKTLSGCLKFAMELLRFFERYHCKDATVILEVFQIFQCLTGNASTFLDKSIKSENFFCIPYGEEKCNTDLVWDAARLGNLGLLKLRLKFGLVLMVPYSTDCSETIIILLYNWPCSCYNGSTEDNSAIHHDSCKAERVQRLILTNSSIQKSFRRNFNTESMKRLSLVLKILDLVLKMKLCGPHYKEHFTECYRLIFHSIPEPYVSSFEVKATLEKILPPSLSLFISRITEDFKCMLPELAEIPQPRSLQHLCRIQVRQCLRQNLNLLHGVSSLPLPSILKQYIMLNDNGDYSVIAKPFVTYNPRMGGYFVKPGLYIRIPVGDDRVTSVLKHLIDDC